jgi:endonuclease G
MTRAYARLALREAVRHHFSDRNVTLIEFGFKEQEGRLLEDELAVRFHVRKKLYGHALEMAVDAGQTQPIPEKIGMFQTDVSEGTFYPHRWGWGTSLDPRAVQTEPMRGGISISDEYHYAYGTLGGLVRDRVSGAELILSNWHVLAVDWWARPGQRIYQPGRLDGGSHTQTVATLTRDSMAQNLDAAVATLTGGRRLINEQLGLGPIRGVTQPKLGLEVIKSGRRTGITRGRVVAVEGVAKIRYGYLDRLIRQVVRIEPLWTGGEVSGPGDSGAIWLEKATMQAIGLHFAGSNMPEEALALDMLSVLNALKVELVTTA